MVGRSRWGLSNLPRPWRNGNRANIVPSHLDPHRRRRSCGAERLRRRRVLAAGAPGREPPAADVRADAGLAEIVLRSGPAAVDGDAGGASRGVVVNGSFLRFLDEFSVALCIVRRDVERGGFGALFCSFFWGHVEAPFEQGRRCRASSAGEHGVPCSKRQFAALRRTDMLELTLG